jgi:hypothetical protein
LSHQISSTFYGASNTSIQSRRKAAAIRVQGFGVDLTVQGPGRASANFRLNKSKRSSQHASIFRVPLEKFVTKD